MYIYKTRPGVVLTEICGEYLLVSAKNIRDICPYVTQINESSAFLWRQLEKGTDTGTLLSAVYEEFEVTDRADAGAALESFLAQMSELGYLLRERKD